MCVCGYTGSWKWARVCCRHTGITSFWWQKQGVSWLVCAARYGTAGLRLLTCQPPLMTTCTGLHRNSHSPTHCLPLHQPYCQCRFVRRAISHCCSLIGRANFGGFFVVSSATAAAIHCRNDSPTVQHRPHRCSVCGPVPVPRLYFAACLLSGPTRREVSTSAGVMVCV